MLPVLGLLTEVVVGRISIQAFTYGKFGNSPVDSLLPQSDVKATRQEFTFKPANDRATVSNSLCSSWAWVRILEY